MHTSAFNHRKTKLIDRQQMIDEEEMNSSYGEEDEQASSLGLRKTERDHQIEQASLDMNQEDFQLGYFDDFGQFRYNKLDFEEQNEPQRKHIDLKDLTEQTFLELTESKNQDKRFYYWLHLHPLFDEGWADEDGIYFQQKKVRRGSEQINLKQGLHESTEHFQEEINESSLKKDDDEAALDFFQELYAGVSNMFENAEEEVETHSSPYGFLQAE